MHELSVVNSLIELCEQNAKANDAQKVIKVEVKIGKLSGIEPHFLQLTFDTFKEKTICENAKLLVNIQEVIIECLSCGFQGTLKNNEFICEKCGGNDVRVVDGEDMVLMRLEME
ncbi:MAG: hydrogenase maturation nickel metallochaperone HypA [Campylobacteraceae bacterium]|jgi:hydrogenase nickel incorporation protein HypA/HybF|nr:hydrogenase maturation nickel metallochaperone HypA [Campylobacteraceae bacterium]